MIDIHRTVTKMEAQCRMLSNPEYMRDTIKVLEMWGDLKHRASQWDVGMAPQYRLNSIIKKMEEEYFPKPKPKSRRERINDMLNCLSEKSIHPDKMELVNLLIELRDEEENV